MSTNTSSLTGAANAGTVSRAREWAGLLALVPRGNPLPVLLTLGLAAVVGVFVFTVHSGSGDYGQWLMVSRFYLGEPLPEYREVISIPPTMPALLALVRIAVDSDVLAVQVFRGLLGAALVVSTYLAGSALFRDRLAGLMAISFAFLVSDRLLEPFAFGGLPQLTAMVAVNLSVASFMVAGAGPPKRRWWVAGALCLLLTGTSHFATGLIGVTAGVTVAGTSALGAHCSWSERFRVLFPLGVALVVLGSYYVQLLLPTNSEYATNPASLNYRGPERIVDILVAYPPTLLVLGLGVVALSAGVTTEASRRSAGGFAIGALWFSAPAAALAVAVITQASTDYPRFIPLLVMPLAVLAAGGAAVTLRATAEALAELHPRMRQSARVLGAFAIALVLALAGASTLTAHRLETAGYQVASMEQLHAAAAWLDAELSPGDAILTSAREGKWLEGFNGRPGLFTIPARYSFRDVERSRGMAAETLLRSTAALNNSTFFVKYFGRTGNVPTSPWIALNHFGEYVDIVRLPTAGTSITVRGPYGRPVTVSLADLKPVTSWRTIEKDGVSVHTNWQGTVDGEFLSYTRTIALRDSGFELTDRVSGDATVIETAIELLPAPGALDLQVQLDSPQDVRLHLEPRGRAEPRLAARTGGTWEVTERGFRTSAPGYVLGISMTGLNAGVDNRLPPRVLVPDDLFDEYRVGTILLKDTPALKARLARLGDSGFEVARRFGPYVALMRQPGRGDRGR